MQTTYWRTLFYLWLACLVGCKPETPEVEGLHDSPASASETGELSFEDQLDAVHSGSSTSIRTNSSVSEQQLTLLAGNPVLEELLLDRGELQDSSVHLLVQLPKLRHLRLRHSALTDHGIVELLSSELPELQVLNLPQSLLTAQGIEHLRQFPKLKQLRLGGELLDDEAAATLARLPSLESLHLIGPRFTDAALEQLAIAPRLASLYIDECRFSDGAWKKLFQVKPNLHVHIDQHHHDLDPKREH